MEIVHWISITVTVDWLKERLRSRLTSCRAGDGTQKDVERGKFGAN